jgi:hypothetical protein
VVPVFLKHGFADEDPNNFWEILQIYGGISFFETKESFVSHICLTLGDF